LPVRLRASWVTRRACARLERAQRERRSASRKHLAVVLRGPSCAMEAHVLSTSMSYRLIARDIDKSLDRVGNQAAVKRETAYFEANIGKVTSVEEFLDNTRLFNYAMKAFGLSEMAYAKGFMKKVLKEGVTDPESFANKLT